MSRMRHLFLLHSEWHITETYRKRRLTSTISDNAGTLGITVASDKTIIGEGSSGVIKGKGLRIVSGASNIIIQYDCHLKPSKAPN